MDAISQTTFWNEISWMKMYEYRLKFHWSLFLRVKLTISHHWFRLWLGADQATSHYLDQWWLDYRRIYASLGLNELINGRFLGEHTDDNKWPVMRTSWLYRRLKRSHHGGCWWELWPLHYTHWPGGYKVRSLTLPTCNLMMEQSQKVMLFLNKPY